MSWVQPRCNGHPLAVTITDREQAPAPVIIAVKPITTLLLNHTQYNPNYIIPSTLFFVQNKR